MNTLRELVPPLVVHWSGTTLTDPYPFRIVHSRQKESLYEWYRLPQVKGACVVFLCPFFVNVCAAPLQSSDADVVAGPAEDGRQQQERPLGHELHQVTQQPGRPTDRVSVRTCAFGQEPGLDGSLSRSLTLALSLSLSLLFMILHLER